MNDTPIRPRSPRTAVWLSQFLPGLGQIYLGHLHRGMLIAFVSIVVLACSLAAIATAPRNAGPILLWTLVAAIVLVVVAASDARRLARRADPEYRLRDYNSWQFYTLVALVSIFGSAVGYAFVLREKYVHAFRIPMRSMAPTLVPGDRILGIKNVYLESDPKLGDLVIFRYPDNRRQHYVKRVAGLPGDVVEIHDGQLFVNEIPTTPVPGGVPPLDPVTVPPHHCYVLGDNLANSKDSRHFGPIPIAGLVARADFIILPGKDWSRFGRIK